LVNKIAIFQSLLPLRSMIPLVIVQARLAKARVLETTFPISGGMREFATGDCWSCCTDDSHVPSYQRFSLFLRVEIRGDAD
jgi:hypothetical protein